MGAGDIYQMNVGGTDGQGNFFENTFHYKDVGGAAIDAYDTARDIIATWPTTNLNTYKACIPTDSRINILSCRRVFGGGAPTATNPISLQGTYPAVTLSNILAGLIAWVPGGGGVHLGRTFMPAMPVGGIIVDALGAGYRIAVEAFAAVQLVNLTGVLAGAAYAFVLYNRKTFVVTPIADYVVRGRVSSLRKRTLPIL